MTIEADRRQQGEAIADGVFARQRLKIPFFVAHAKEHEKAHAAPRYTSPEGAEFLVFAQFPARNEIKGIKTRFPQELLFVVTDFGHDAELAQMVEGALEGDDIGPFGIVTRINKKDPHRGDTEFFDPTSYLPDGLTDKFPVPTRLTLENPLIGPPALTMALLDRVPLPTEAEVQVAMQQAGL